MKELTVYFELERKKFSLDLARSVVQIWVDKYGLNEIDVEKEANALYNSGVGDAVSFVNLPYHNLIIEAQTKPKYSRIPKTKLYVYISTDITNLGKKKEVRCYVDDAVRLYHVLKPNFGVCDVEDMLEFDGTHFLRGPRIYNMVFFSPSMVNSIGSDQFVTFGKKIYEVRELEDGGMMIRFTEKLQAGTKEQRDLVSRQLGVKKFDE